MITTRTTILIAIGGLLAGGLGAPAAAAGQHYDYDNWHLSIDTIDTGEDIRTTCRIHTGGDGDPVLSVEISDGDAGPPDYYPDVVLSERAPRGHDTVMQDGARIGFLTEIGQGFDGTAQRWINDEGFAEAHAAIAPDQTLAALQAMAEDGLFEISMADDVVFTAMFHGFAAAYGHMVEACGFTGEGVLDIHENNEVERAETLYFEYRDWRVAIYDYSSDQHDLISCVASTGGDGSPVISVDQEMRDGEAPNSLPAVIVTESPPRGSDSIIQQDAPVLVGFDDRSSRSAAGARWVDEDGFVQAQVAFFEHEAKLALLRGMRRNREVYVVSGDRLVAKGSLLGFTAAYGKIAEQCRFSTADVIE